MLHCHPLSHPLLSYDHLVPLPIKTISQIYIPLLSLTKAFFQTGPDSNWVLLCAYARPILYLARKLAHNPKTQIKYTLATGPRSFFVLPVCLLFSLYQTLVSADPTLDNTTPSLSISIYN